MNSSFLSKTAFATFFCLLAAISPAFPWGRTGFYYGDTSQQFFSAYHDWHGAAITVTAGFGVLFLLATGGLKPAPWWRTLGIAIVGIAILTITIIFSTHHWNHFPVDEYGGLFAIIATIGLMVIVALEVRGALEKRSSPSPAVPPAA